MPSQITAEFLAQYQSRTARVYASPLAEFERLTGVPVEHATHDDVLTYQAAQEGLSASTIGRKLSTLASLFSYLLERGIRSDDPMRGVRRARYRVDPAATVKYLDADEASAVMRAAATPRERALVAVLLHGLRVGETVGLDVSHVRDGALVGLVGKGGKVRTVPLTSEAQAIVAAYIGERRSGALYLSRSRRRLSVRMAQDIIYAVSERAGNRINPHRLRHSAATHWLRSGVGLDRVQDLLGHVKSDTTRIYAKLTVGDLRDAVDSVEMLGSGAGVSITLAERVSPAPVSSYPERLRVIQGGRRGPMPTRAVR